MVAVIYHYFFLVQYNVLNYKSIFLIIRNLYRTRVSRLLLQLGYDKIWNSENPFDFMELISLRPKANFFELRVGEYAKSSIAENDDQFELNNDF